MEYEQAFKNRGQRYDYAMQKYGTALQEEFATAIRVLDLQPYESLVNIPAGGIPLDMYIDPTLKIEYLGFEPSQEHEKQNIEYCDFTSIPLDDMSVDKIISLAAFHHVQEKRSETLREFHRILKTNGMLVIGDVIDGSPQAYWLNVFVNQYNSNGHKGLFLKEEEACRFEELGYKVETSRHVYHWTFENDKQATDFVTNLFGLDLIPSSDMLLGAMQEFLGYKDNKFEWQLLYFKCTKSSCP